MEEEPLHTAHNPPINGLPVTGHSLHPPSWLPIVTAAVSTLPINGLLVTGRRPYPPSAAGFGFEDSAVPWQHVLIMLSAG